MAQAGRSSYPEAKGERRPRIHRRRAGHGGQMQTRERLGKKEAAEGGWGETKWANERRCLKCALAFFFYGGREDRGGNCFQVWDDCSGLPMTRPLVAPADGTWGWRHAAITSPYMAYSECHDVFQGGVIDRENSLGDRHGEVRSRRSLRGEDDVTLQSPTVRVAIDIDSSSSLQRVGRFDQVYWNVLSLV
ncbi:hypothetical protein OPV22_015192 [Ensete ventricosum]|uniref:Uncharacterized protein n=1 Tax=Ensete ventricosum TaxID=4639 RepID=A0AAV8RDK7_ENSVE|nr:hypothetical protein OPV22_015192 [Ensete ventricosum]